MSEQYQPPVVPEARPNLEIVPDQQLEQAFQYAEHAIADITLQPEFTELCETGQIDPMDPSKPEFWKVIAQCGRDSAAVERHERGNRMEVNLAEIVTATPNYIFDQQVLDKDRFDSREDRRAAKESASHFNGLMRSFVENYPDTDKNDFLRGLDHVIRTCITDRAQQDDGIDNITDVVRGARHEAVFGKLLELTGHNFRHSTTEEDLHGIDYALDGPPALNIDVKTSPRGFHSHNTGFSIDKRRGNATWVKVLSPLSNRELGTKLMPSEAELREKAGELEPVLDHIEQVA